MEQAAFSAALAQEQAAFSAVLAQYQPRVLERNPFSFSLGQPAEREHSVRSDPGCPQRLVKHKSCYISLFCCFWMVDWFCFVILVVIWIASLIFINNHHLINT